jgi:hypothetical protein
MVVVVADLFAVDGCHSLASMIAPATAPIISNTQNATISPSISAPINLIAVPATMARKNPINAPSIRCFIFTRNSLSPRSPPHCTYTAHPPPSASSPRTPSPPPSPPAASSPATHRSTPAQSLFSSLTSPFRRPRLAAAFSEIMSFHACHPPLGSGRPRLCQNRLLPLIMSRFTCAHSPGSSPNHASHSSVERARACCAV